MPEMPIDYWRGMYCAHARTDAYKRRVEGARAIVHQALETFEREGVKYYCSISGGKDSTAMMHLVWSIAPATKFMSVKDDMDFPEELPYLEDLRARYNLDLDIEHPPRELWEAIKEHDVCEDVHGQDTGFSREAFYGVLKTYKERHGHGGVFVGLRAAESKGRRMLIKSRGPVFHNATWNEWEALPLAQWSAQDVMAYLFSNEVPILPVYFCTAFCDSPEQIRKSWCLPGSQAAQGQVVWLKHYYPDLYRRLCIVQPDVRAYS